MTKKEIIETLKNLPFSKDEYIVISDAAMTVQGIKEETSDIDLAISEKLEHQISDFKYHLSPDNSKIYELPNIELFRTYYEETSWIEIDGIRYATLESILNLKKALNRKKDQKDIKALDLALCLQDNHRYEKVLSNQGITLIAGVDEVGRGPLVGPVVAAAVILPINYELKGLTDSKKLSEKKREEFYEIIMHDAVSIGIGIVGESQIDEVNIYEATKLAMCEAINNLNPKPEHVLIDAMPLSLSIPTTSIIKGDIKSISISAASVIAKVTRDRMINALGEKYPYYNFKKNKGYPTKEHLNAIKNYGIIKEHRKSYGPVREYLESINHEI